MLMCFWRGRSTPAIRAIPCSSAAGSALALFVFRVNADHPHHTLTVNDLALVTDFLYGRSYFHKPAFSRQLSAFSKNLFVAIHNPAAIQIVRRKLHGDL